MRLGLDLSDESGPWQCSPCGPPGTSKDLTGYFTSGAGGGIVQLDGASYPVPDQAEVFLLPIGGPVILPPMSAGAVLSAPFELGAGTLFLHEVGGVPLQTFPLVGGGTATIELTPNRFEPLWEFVQCPLRVFSRSRAHIAAAPRHGDARAGGETTMAAVETIEQCAD